MQQRILISGSTGLVGSSLVSHLCSSGHSVFHLVRNSKENKQDTISWNPQKGEARVEDFEGFDAIIHLAGKNISSRRWTKKIKEEIFLSRCRDTWLLSQILLRLKEPPKIVICASATGIYGDRGEEILTEKSPPGKGFLADVCQKWEQATRGIENRQMRVVHTRFGLILSPKGGMLAKILPTFRLGLGAILGSGGQYLPWIALEDVVQGIEHILKMPQLAGPINMTAPEEETNASFSQKLAKALHRPLLLRIGEKPLRWIFGEMADELFLASSRAIPEKLQKSGYQFLFPSLEEYFKQHFS